MKPPYVTDSDVETSVRMLRDGATPGMVARRLEREGVPKHSRVQVVSYAQSIVHRRERLVACGIAVGGMFIFSLGVGLLVLFRMIGVVRAKLPFVLLMTGMMVAMYGVMSALRSRN